MALVCVIPLLPDRVCGQEYPFRHYTNRDLINPLPGMPVYGITQDDAGLMWFGMIGHGIYRYDGSDLFKVAESSSPLSPTAFIQDEAGFLWVNTINGLFVSDRPLSENGYPVLPEFTDTLQINSGPVKIAKGSNLAYGLDAFARDPDTGGIWAATGSEGLMYFNFHEDGSRKAKLLKPTEVFPERDDEINDIYSVLARANGELLAVTRGGYLFSVSREQKLRFLKDGTLPDFAFRRFDRPETLQVHISLMEDEQGRLFGGTTLGKVWMMHAPSIYSLMADFEQPFYPDHIEDAGSGMVFQLLDGTDGTVWAGTGEGLARFHLDEGIPLHYLNGINGISVNVLHRDSEGNIWASTNDGIFKLRAGAGAVERLRSPSASFMETIQATAVAADPGDPSVLWIGSQTGLVEARLHPGRYEFELHRFPEIPVAKEIFSITSHHDGSIWLDINNGVIILFPRSISGTFNPYPGIDPDHSGPAGPGRKYYYYSQKNVQYNFKPRLLNGKPVMLANTVNEIHVTTEEGSRNTGRFSTSSRPGMGSFDIGPDGHMWVGTMADGLLRSVVPFSRMLEDETGNCTGATFCYKPAVLDFAASSTDQRYFAFIGERLYLAGPEGLHELESDTNGSWKTIRSWDKNSGLNIPVPISYIHDSERGYLWMAGAGGVHALNLESGQIELYVSERDGMISDQLYYPSSFGMFKGDLIFGSVAGAYRIRPEKLRKQRQGPKAIISDYNITGNRFGRNEFEVRFASPSFEDELSTVFAYRLSGQDREWIYPGRMNSTRYTNLSAVLFPKEYRFDVKAVNGYGMESDSSASLAFTVHPPFFLRWWFLALGFGVMLFSGGVFYNRRVEKMRIQQQEQALRRQFEITQRIGSLVAHDMKNTVFSLTFLARNLDRKFEQEAFRKDAITTLQQSTRHLNDLISKLQQNRPQFTLKGSSANPDETISAVIRRLRMNLPDGVSLNYEGDKKLQWTHDSGAVTRIAENLIQNAIDAVSSKGGQVTVTFGPDKRGRPQLSVSDNGPGMPALFIRDELFEPFKTTKPQGLGLGMYSVKLLTEDHGGSVEVQSREGHGTSFLLSFNPDHLKKA